MVLRLISRPLRETEKRFKLKAFNQLPSVVCNPAPESFSSFIEPSTLERGNLCFALPRVSFSTLNSNLVCSQKVFFLEQSKVDENSVSSQTGPARRGRKIHKSNLITSIFRFEFSPKINSSDTL